MIEDYFRDKCDIYHLKDETVNVGYGISASTVKDWPETPDEEDVPCHFHVRNGTLQPVQTDPATELDGLVKLSLPYGVDIRKNDIVVSKACESIEPGIRFRAAIPRSIHNNHHITVSLEREDGIKGAI